MRKSTKELCLNDFTLKTLLRKRIQTHNREKVSTARCCKPSDQAPVNDYDAVETFEALKFCSRFLSGLSRTHLDLNLNQPSVYTKECGSHLAAVSNNIR